MGGSVGSGATIWDAGGGGGGRGRGENVGGANCDASRDETVVAGFESMGNERPSADMEGGERFDSEPTGRKSDAYVVIPNAVYREGKEVSGEGGGGKGKRMRLPR